MEHSSYTEPVYLYLSVHYIGYRVLYYSGYYYACTYVYINGELHRQCCSASLLNINENSTLFLIGLCAKMKRTTYC